MNPFVVKLKNFSLTGRFSSKPDFSVSSVNFGGQLLKNDMMLTQQGHILGMSSVE